MNQGRQSTSYAALEFRENDCLVLLAAAVCLTLWPPGCSPFAQGNFRNGTYSGSTGQVLTIKDNEFTYGRVGDTLDTSCNWATAVTQSHEQSLYVGPDQSRQLPAGQYKSYCFYALIEGDTGGIVEVALPTAPAGWSVRLADMTGESDLTDTDGDGIPDLGYVVPGKTTWFALGVMAASGLAGDTAFTHRFAIAGRMGNDSLAADTAILSLTVFSCRFSGTYAIVGHAVTFTTTRLNGDPTGLQQRTTFDFTSTANSITLTNMRNLIDGGCGIGPDTYTNAK